MDLVHNLIMGFNEIFHLVIMIDMLIGVVAGIVASAIPGFTITMAIVLTLPFTYSMSPVQGLATMIGVYVGGYSGGLITAALLGIPGTPSAVATTFDGYPMVKNGEPGRALGIGITASFLGSIISTIVLILAAPPLAELALAFGPWEYFSLIVFALTIIASIVGDSILKGLMAGLIGLGMATIGQDPIIGATRLTFGIDPLKKGLPFLVVLIGIFAVSRIMEELEDPIKVKKGEKLIVEDFEFNPLKSFKEVVMFPITVIRSSLAGTLIGAIPGAGGSISNILAYNLTKNFSSHPEKFGTGIPEGTVSSEAGNSGTAGGGMIPMIAFGIPGSAVSAVMIGALMLHGINPGPMLIQNEPELVYGIFIAFFVASAMMLVTQLLGVRFFLRVAQIPKYILMPSILAACGVGAYVLNNSLFDVQLLFYVGLIGYALKKFNYPLAPIILGVILGPIAEKNLRRALMTEYDYSLFLTRPISAGLLGLAVVSILFAIYTRRRQSLNVEAEESQ